MTLFELVKLALDELYEEAERVHGDDVDDKIKKKLRYLTQSYFQLSEEGRKAISYRDPVTRFAYVLKYAAAHGDYIVQTLEDLRDLTGGKIFTNSTVRVSCVGGGPGSDLMGVIKYLSENLDEEQVEKMTCFLLDGEQAWADTWTEIYDALECEFSITPICQPLDVTKPESWESQRKFLTADLFTFSYFLSEVKGFNANGVVEKFWKEIFDNAKVGAYFLYIDNGSEEFNNFFDGLWEGRGDIQCLSKTGKKRIIPRFSEQADDLGEYRTKFHQHPKIQSTVAIRLLKKVK